MDFSLILVSTIAIIGWIVSFVSLRRLRVIPGLRQKIAELEPLVFVDVLTGTGNRRKFDDSLASMVPHTMRAEESIVVLYLDVNDFKAINDRFGHPFGDRVLRRVSESIGDAVRPTDIVCRFGGDEFAVILPHCDVAGARIVAGRIARALSTNAVSYGDELVHPHVSIGGTCLETEGGQILVGEKFVGSFTEPGLAGKINPLICQGADNRLYDAKKRKQTRKNPDGEPYPIEIS